MSSFGVADSRFLNRHSKPKVDVRDADAEPRYLRFVVY